MRSTEEVLYASYILGKLPEIDPTENDMLECTVSPREENSRLSCQIKVTEALDGLVVRLPETQV